MVGRASLLPAGQVGNRQGFCGSPETEFLPCGENSDFVLQAFKGSDEAHVHHR